ncbi:hypothetical protein FFLO_06977 [Filobasidium floriforme]|uniref:Tyrosine-protein kinase ephrin type A/B receptor-like domain-containing protein n=1 Tax=Filobasidium floriforme TaxID=5210 RepID=A0A8K0JDV7_9TREE|nr:uncharacterized protein HD553DRAFT_91742 [Filobasidium floriforme]KAG7527398.1 hypothetical protein FFLO_06977 [Filobasidium floriforme]KAH8089423.1 hypothetical protein HD553DRAFT_91742 [Filobasidium floriforme]
MIWTRFLSITLFALTTARAQDQQCPPGNELRGDECQPCYPGGFSAGGSDPCQVCPGGSISADFGASSCTQCPANTYANYDGASCSDCPEYTTSDPGTAGPQQCRATNCPPGAVGVGSQCFGCDAGTYASGTYPGVCLFCEPGQQANEARTGCETCQAGTYSEIGAFCVACEAGYTSEDGASECMLAPSGSFSRRDQTLMRVGACTRSQTACMVGQEKWECIDTLTDLQSCGGCWTDGSGVDCTLLDHPDMSDGMQIACVDGRCQEELILTT